MKQQQNGFTLIEVMVTLSILAIAAAFVVPSINSYFVNLRLKTSARGLFADLNLAKISAMKTLHPYTLLLGPGSPARQGWIVFRDTNDDGELGASEKIITEADLEGGITLLATDVGTSITFDRNGLINRGEGTYTLESSQYSKQISLAVSLAGFIHIK